MKRLVIIDYNGMAYKYMFGANTRFSCVVNGERYDTTIPAFTIKEMVKLSKNGDYDLAVVRDIGQSTERTRIMKDVFDMVYKEGRKSAPKVMYEGMDLAYTMLRAAGVSVYGSLGIEADDIIASLVYKYGHLYDRIYIYTGDKDMLPLVDEKVSVLYRRPKMYLPINPVNYNGAVNNISKFKEYLMPYNSVGLYLWLKGDAEDNIPGLQGLGPKAYNKLINLLNAKGFDFTRATLQECNKEYILDFVVQYLANTSEARDYIREFLTASYDLVAPHAIEVSQPHGYDWQKMAQVLSAFSINLNYYKEGWYSK